MQSTVPAVGVKLAAEGVVFEVASLYAALAGLTDRRHARGIRYTLAHVLVYILLAKLAGQDRLSGIADWVKYRQETLAQLLGLSRPRTPSLNTYRRVLGQSIDIEEFERVVRDFFAALPEAGTSRERAMDGKTLRGTIVTGQMQGRHLLAVFLPSEGWVELQVEVGSHENEISAAPGVLKSLDLQGKVVTGDAIFAQRDLSQQIVEAGGDYVWTVKDNQPQLRHAIEQLFQTETCLPGTSPVITDIQTAQTLEKSHGLHIPAKTITHSG
jgi:predicted transposase YbfD/YdcC